MVALRIILRGFDDCSWQGDRCYPERVDDEAFRQNFPEKMGIVPLSEHKSSDPFHVNHLNDI